MENKSKIFKVPFLDTIKIKGEERYLLFYFLHPGCYDIYIETDCIGFLYENDVDSISIRDEFENYEEEIANKFNAFLRNKSEIMIGESVSYTDLKNTYLSLLLQTLVLKNTYLDKSMETAYSQYLRAADWLNKGDFFTAPSSTRFHDADEKGLVYHTLKVYNYMIDLKQTNTFFEVGIAEMTLCALVHDWCKINLYEPYMKNIKDEATGNWIQEPAYRYTYPKFPFGHGETSLYLASKFFNLSLEESLAIRWHMGKYYVDDGLNNDLECACAKYPLVNMLHFADKLSITEY